MSKIALSFLMLLLSSCKASVSVSERQQSSEETTARTLAGLQGADKAPYLDISKIPDQKTIFCPAVPQDLYADRPHYGIRTRFVIKNTASEPVVVAYVDENGAEYSAANYRITPPLADPEAILEPGVTKVFAVNEGHVFHVRDPATGELLMQHRAGLLSIENNYDHEIECSAEDEAKTETIDSSPRILRKFQNWKPANIEQYTQQVSIHTGFRNTIKSSRDGRQCAVNVYFVKKQSRNPHRKPNYIEKFSFHLGANNFVMDQWDSMTKHETTFLGHEFAVRLASNDNIVVDYLSVEPIRVHACANKKKQTVKATAHSGAIVIPVGSRDSLADAMANQTDYQAFVASHNSTESRRGLYFKMMQSE
jgi:hypothetical protein